jgi:DNA polymerase
MKIKDLNKEYDKLQKEYGCSELDSIYNGGLEENPDICFVFMNPTGRNIASSKEWKGRKSPWIGTKNIWTLFYELDLVDSTLYEKIRAIKGKDWTEEFAEEVYLDVIKHKYFITNLGKCTQIDARPLPDSVYLKYLSLLEREIEILNPKVIILFGNQVSSLVLGQKITVSTCRCQAFEKEINGKIYKCYSVYYPIGNGIFNIDKSIEDIKWIINAEIKN